MRTPGLLSLTNGDRIKRPAVTKIPIPDQAELTVGTDESNMIVIDAAQTQETGVAPQHCVFRRDGEVITVHSIGNNPISVGDQLIASSQRLDEGDLVTIGDSTAPQCLYFQVRDLATVPPIPSMVY